jgi:pyroglutamyl-peptidase
MSSVLLTAFEPYESWSTNASWSALVELTRDLPSLPQITTRLYPVDFALVRERLAYDLQANYDYALHLGQAPGSARIQLEAIGVNVASSERDQLAPPPLMPDGPMAYRSSLPLDEWCTKLRNAGIPAEVSFHAGTYLCNAALYLTHYFSERMGLKTRAAFLHLPLEPAQVIHELRDLPSMPATTSAMALRLLLAELAGPALA